MSNQMEKNILISQMNSNYWSMILKGLGFLEGPDVGLPVRQDVMGVIRAATESHIKFIDSVSNLRYSRGSQS